MSQTPPGDVIETSDRPADPARRTLLGALALGFVASACSSDEPIANLGAPGSTGGTDPVVNAGGPTTLATQTAATESTLAATETGPELAKVTLPRRGDGTAGETVGTAPRTGSGSGGGGGGTETAAPRLPEARSSPSTAPAAAPAASAPPAVQTSPSSSPTTAAYAPPAPLLPAPAPASTPSSTTAPAPGPTSPTTVAPAVTVPPSSAPAPAPSTPPTSAPGPTTPPALTQDPPFTPPEGLATNAGPIHVANRLTFGVTPAIMTDITNRGTGGFVEDQLARTGLDNEVENRLGRFRLLNQGNRATYNRLRDIGGNKLVGELTHLNVLRAAFSRNQLYEMMCHLWYDHFSIHLFGNDRSQHLHIDHQENVIRPNAMGTFRNLLIATANSPAMLTFLDNDASNANSDEGVNENYGRELLELHTLGIDENGDQVYTEADVRATALAMSGWSMERDRDKGNFTEFMFRDNYHHTDEVSILNGAWTSAGTTGKQTGDSLLEFLATHPSTARYVAYKICRRFVADVPPPRLLDSTAQAYLAADTDIVATLRHVFTSAEFAASEGQKMRRPFEATVAQLRALHADIPNDPEGRSAERLRNVIDGQNHIPWYWDQPNGYPDDARFWLSSDGLLNRWTVAALLARNNLTGGDGDKIRTDYGALRPQAANVGEFVGRLGEQFGVGAPGPEVVSAIAAASRLNPADAVGTVDNDKLADIAGLLLAHPLFQTR